MAIINGGNIEVSENVWGLGEMVWVNKGSVKGVAVNVVSNLLVEFWENSKYLVIF